MLPVVLLMVEVLEMLNQQLVVGGGNTKGGIPRYIRQLYLDPPVRKQHQQQQQASVASCVITVSIDQHQHTHKHPTFSTSALSVFNTVEKFPFVLASCSCTKCRSWVYCSSVADPSSSMHMSSMAVLFDGRTPKMIRMSTYDGLCMLCCIGCLRMQCIHGVTRDAFKGT